MTEPVVQRQFTNAYVEELRLAAEADDVVAKYEDPVFDLDRERVRNTPLGVHGFKPSLLVGGKTVPGDDGKNAILLHRYLGTMTEEQAADGRLWAYLTHVAFRDYVQARFDISKSKNPSKVVANRWFLRGGRQGITGNAIARLWWGAQLTVAPWVREDTYFASLTDPDPYRYTKLLFRNQDVAQGLLERRFGSSHRVRICLLEAMRRHAEDFGAWTDLFQRVQKNINLMCSSRVLSGLEFDVLMAVMEQQVLDARAAVTR